MVNFTIIAQPRCRAYIEIDDNTGRLTAVLFGTIAEDSMGCTAIDFMNNTGEEHLPYVQNITTRVRKRMGIHVAANIDELKKQRHKNFTVISMHPITKTTS